MVESRLEQLVNKEMAGPSAEAMAMARTVLMAGGKRWRPVLTLLAHEAAGGKISDEIMIWQQMSMKAQEVCDGLGIKKVSQFL